MAYALVAFEIPEPPRTPTRLENWRSGRTQPSPIQRVTSTLFQVELPNGLPELGRMLDDIERDNRKNGDPKIRVLIEWRTDAPVFASVEV